MKKSLKLLTSFASIVTFASVLTPLVSCSEQDTTSRYHLITDQDSGIRSIKVTKNHYDEDVVINFSLFDGWELDEVHVDIDGVQIDDFTIQGQNIIINHDLITNYDSVIYVQIWSNEIVVWYDVSFETNQGVKTIETTQNHFDKNIVIKYSLNEHYVVDNVSVIVDNNPIEFSLDESNKTIKIDYHLIPSYTSEIVVTVETSQFFENGYNISIFVDDPVHIWITENTIGNDIILNYWVSDFAGDGVTIDVSVDGKIIDWSNTFDEIWISHDDLEADDEIIVTVRENGEEPLEPDPDPEVEDDNYYDLEIISDDYDIYICKNEYQNDIVLMIDGVWEKEPTIWISNFDIYPITDFTLNGNLLTIPYSSFSAFEPTIYLCIYIYRTDGTIQ